MENKNIPKIKYEELDDEDLVLAKAMERAPKRNKDYYCIHKKFKYTCKICKGSQICKHNRYKQSCRDCEGDLFCTHGRRKYYC